MTERLQSEIAAALPAINKRIRLLERAVKRGSFDHRDRSVSIEDQIRDLREEISSLEDEILELENLADDLKEFSDVTDASAELQRLRDERRRIDGYLRSQGRIPA